MSDSLALAIGLVVCFWWLWFPLFYIWRHKRDAKRYEREQLIRSNKLKEELASALSHLMASKILYTAEGAVAVYQAYMDAGMFIYNASGSSFGAEEIIKRVVKLGKCNDLFNGRYLPLSRYPSEEERTFIEKLFVDNSYAAEPVLQSAGLHLIEVPVSESALETKTRIRDRERERIREAARKCASDIIAESKEGLFAKQNCNVAVYIIEGKKSYKIGVSDDPRKRISELQTGHPHKLKVRGCYWLPDRRDAYKVEKGAHAVLQSEQKHAYGEWFECSLVEASSAIERTIFALAKSKRIKVPVDRDSICVSDPKLSVVYLALGAWRRTRRGNWQVAIDGVGCTVFKHGLSGKWKFVVDGNFSEKSYYRLQDAKADAMAGLCSEIK